MSADKTTVASGSSATTPAKTTAAKGKAPATEKKVKIEKKTDAADGTTDSGTTEGSPKKEGGRSIFLKVSGETYVHHELFRELLTIGSKRVDDNTTVLTLGFRDGRELSSQVPTSEISKASKRLKDYAKSDHCDTTEQKGRSTFLKIHNETYVHFSLFQDLVTISSDVQDDGNYLLQLNFRDGRHVVTDVPKDDITRAAKRVRDFYKRLTKVDLSDATDAETDGETAKASSSKVKKEKKPAAAVDGPVSATLSS